MRIVILTIHLTIYHHNIGTDNMQTNSGYTKTKKSNKQESLANASYTAKQEKANKPKRDKNLFKSWSV